MTTTAPPDIEASAKFAPQLTCLLILVALIDSQVVAAVAPQIAAGLAAAETTVAAGVAVYAVSAAAVALWLARSARAARPRQGLPAAAVLFAAGCLITATAPHVSVFLAGRAVAGFAGGLISALAIAAIANASSYENRGSQMSWVAISYFLAPVLGVPLGTALAGALGWRSIFVASAVMAGVAGELVRRFPLARVAPVDAETAAGQAPAASLWQLFSRSRSTRMGVLGAFFVSGGLVGFTTYLGVWLARAFAAGPRDVGLVYALAGLGAVAGGAIGGKLADRVGKRRVAAGASIAMALALLAVPTFAWGTGLFAAVAAAAFVASLRVAPLQALVTELVEPSERSAYVALRNASSQAGIATAVAACGPIFSRWGLEGVALACALLTFIAWASVRIMRDPREPVVARPVRRRLFSGARATLAVVAVIVLVVLPWTLSFLVTKAGTRPDERNRPETPATYGAAYEDVSFRSSDGVELSGWYLPGKNDLTIVMSHGLFRSRYELVERGVDLWKLGYGVLLYDLRRHGASGGEFCTLGYEERHDVEAALAYARGRAGAGRVALFGVSMGAAATLLAAAESEGVVAVVADSSFLSLEHTVFHHVGLTPIPKYPFAPELLWLTAGRMNYDPAAFDVLAAVRKVGVPVLFIGGTADVRMPIATVLEPLYGAATSPLKREYVVEGATHGHAYDQDRATYIRTVDDFLKATAR